MASLNHNYMPILSSDDDVDTWSSSSGSDSGLSSYQQFASSAPVLGSGEYSVYEDYFGLSNLINTIQISEDNPLVQATQKKLAFVQRGRRVSWESDGSDPAVVHSPSLESLNAPASYDDGYGRGYLSGMKSSSIDIAPNNNNINDNNGRNNSGAKMPPPSMRLSRSMREHIISGGYQQERDQESVNRHSVDQPCSPVLSRSANRRPALLPSEGSPPRSQGGLRICVFCRNNGEGESVYTSHVLKDSEGRTTCPILRAYTCPICKANGDNSHTIKYCPLNQKGPQSHLGGVMPAPPHEIGNASKPRGNSGNFQRPGFPQRHPFNMPAASSMPSMPKLR